MASLKDTMVKAVMDPLLNKAGQKYDLFSGLDWDQLKAKPTQHQRITHQKEGPMGALLRFILINAATVIGAKLIDEAGQYITAKLKDRTVRAEIDTPTDAPTLETRTCPKCGAFRVRGEACNCP